MPSERHTTSKTSAESVFHTFPWERLYDWFRRWLVGPAPAGSKPRTTHWQKGQAGLRAAIVQFVSAGLCPISRRLFIAFATASICTWCRWSKSFVNRRNLLCLNDDKTGIFKPIKKLACNPHIFIFWGVSLAENLPRMVHVRMLFRAADAILSISIKSCSNHIIEMRTQTIAYWSRPISNTTAVLGVLFGERDVSVCLTFVVAVSETPTTQIIAAPLVDRHISRPTRIWRELKTLWKHFLRNNIVHSSSAHWNLLVPWFPKIANISNEAACIGFGADLSNAGCDTITSRHPVLSPSPLGAFW